MTRYRNTLKMLAAASALLAAAGAASAAEVTPSVPKANPESIAAGPDGTLYLGSQTAAVIYRAKPGETTATPFIWGLVVYAALASTVGATALLFWLVQRREAGRVTPWFLLTPLVSCTIGVAFMGDRVTPQLVGGGLATMVGVALVALSERRAAQQASSAT